MYKLAVLAGMLAMSVVAACAGEYSRFDFNFGGGVSSPLGPTIRYAGTSGSISAGAGYNITDRNAAILEFMWAGMPSTRSVLQTENAPFGRVNLYTLTANYRYKIDSLRGSRIGFYAIGGGGWYYRYTTINGAYVVPPSTVCQPIFTWWGFGCRPDGFVNASSMTYKFLSAGGLNAGVGFTIRLGDSNWKFYTESRYHYAFSRIPTTLVLVTFGFRFN